MSVWGTSSTDVWAVGADVDDGKGPLVLHYDGVTWTRKLTGATGDLWWVHGFADGTLFMGGEGGLILRYGNGAFETMATPSNLTVFGVWGATSDDVWATGGAAGGASGAFAWHLVNGTWTEAEGFPTDLAATQSLWKVYGRGADDVWFVGTNGIILRYDGAGFEQVPSNTTRSLFTLHGNADRLVAVGGYGDGTIVEYDGSAWVPVVTPEDRFIALTGVCIAGEDGYSVGTDGSVYRRSANGWAYEGTALPVYLPLHAVWIDSEGGVWAVGGETLSEPLVQGIMIHKGLTQIPGGTYVEE